MAPKVKVKKNINDQSKRQKNNKPQSQKLLQEYFKIDQKCQYTTQNIENLMNKQNRLIKEQKKLRYDILRVQNQIIIQVNFVYENTFKNADHEEYNIFTNYFTDKRQNSQNEQSVRKSSTITRGNQIDQGISKQIQTINDDASLKTCSEKNQQQQNRSDIDENQQFEKNKKLERNLDQYKFSKINQRSRTQQMFSENQQEQNQLLKSPISTVTIQSAKLQFKFNLDQFAYETVLRNNQNQNINRQISYNQSIAMSIQDRIQRRKQMSVQCQNSNSMMVNQPESNQSYLQQKVIFVNQSLNNVQLKNDFCSCELNDLIFQNSSQNSQHNFDNLKSQTDYDSQMNLQFSQITSIGQTMNFSTVKSLKRKHEFESTFSFIKCDVFQQVNSEFQDKCHKLNQIIASLERIKQILNKRHNANSKASSFHQALHQINSNNTQLKFKQSKSSLIKQFQNQKTYLSSISFVDQTISIENNSQTQQIQEVEIIMHKKKQSHNSNHLDSCNSDFDILDYILGRQPYCQYYFQNLNQSDSNYFSQQMSGKAFQGNQISTKCTKNQVESIQSFFQIPRQYLIGYKGQIVQLFQDIHMLQLQRQVYKENESKNFHY